MYVVWHENGVGGQCCYTDYTDEEVAAHGGIESLISEYEKKCIIVYSVKFIGGDKK